jgi:hypothetical protein
MAACHNRPPPRVHRAQPLRHLEGSATGHGVRLGPRRSRRVPKRVPKSANLTPDNEVIGRRVWLYRAKPDGNVRLRNRRSGVRIPSGASERPVSRTHFTERGAIASLSASPKTGCATRSTKLVAAPRPHTSPRLTTTTPRASRLSPRRQDQLGLRRRPHRKPAVHTHRAAHPLHPSDPGRVARKPVAPKMSTD